MFSHKKGTSKDILAFFSGALLSARVTMLGEYAPLKKTSYSSSMQTSCLSLTRNIILTDYSMP